MKIVQVKIENFRGLQSIHMDVDELCNVIVGPNAVGKTSVLESIRFVKSALSPRYSQETHNVLVSMGAVSPHVQFLGNQIDVAAIAGDARKETKIGIKFIVSDEEISQLATQVGQLALGLVRSKFGRAEEMGQFAMTQYLSGNEGRAQLSNALKESHEFVERLRNLRHLELSITVAPNSGTFVGLDQLSQLAISVLEQAQPISKSKFNFFPADRAFPSGEVPIQLGGHDAGAQLQSYVGAPATKYQRLKQTLIQGLLTNQVGHAWVAAEFDAVLSALLPGKKFHDIFINQLGLLKLRIREESSNKIFDIDNMSSGEKGLILTFFLIRQTLARGGIVLIDEPELHLNPSICQKLLPYLIDQCAAQDAQIIICSHSGDILASAYERNDCGLFHLRTSTDITRIKKEDHFEAVEALKRLGISTDDVLFYKGSIFVEGPNDVELLNEGFFELTSGYKLQHLSGRGEIEKEIEYLQKVGKGPQLSRTNVFIFDHDNKPTNLSDTDKVKVRQWDRYCLENFLLEEDILFDVVQKFSTNGAVSRGTFKNELKQLAFEQLSELAVRQVYQDMEPENPGIRQKEIAGKTFAEAAEILASRLNSISDALGGFEQTRWRTEFVRDVEARHAELAKAWETNWPRHSDGKKLVTSVQRKFQVNLPILRLKREVMSAMKRAKTENWKIIESTLREVLTNS